MININELRVGNVCRSTVNGGLVTFELLDFYDLYAGNSTAEDYEPISITYEVLYTLGFQKNVDHNHNWLIPDFPFFQIQENGSWVNDKPQNGITYHVYKSYAGSVVEVKALHHIQNVFFFLTGMELKVLKP